MTDELDSLDLEVEELLSIDLQEINNKNKETISTTIRPKTLPFSLMHPLFNRNIVIKIN